MPGPEIVDAHQHFWDLNGPLHYPWLQNEPPIPFRYGDYGAIRRSYLPQDYRRDTARQNVVATVFMEAEVRSDQEVAETRWVHEIAGRHGIPNAVVGHARFEADNIAEVLKGHAAYPLTRAVRQKPRTAATPRDIVAVKGAPGSLGDPRWRRGLARLMDHGLHYELQVPYWHLQEAAELARAMPELRIVLNHTGVPGDRSAAALAMWRDGMAALAGEPNTRVKISGIGLPGEPWTVEANKSIALTTIELFGANRCMFASNFPVDGICASYDTIFDGFQAIVAHLPAGEQRKLFRDNAIREYRIKL